MTYLEKWRKGHPEHSTYTDGDIIRFNCPNDIVCPIEEEDRKFEDCYKCWHKEVPDPCIGCRSYVPETDRCSLKTPCWNHSHYEPKTVYAHIGPFGEERPGTPEEREAIFEIIEELTTNRAPQASISEPRVLDSGARRQFESGAVRDICAGKGRCDLLPLDVVCKCIPYNTHNCAILVAIDNFKNTGDIEHLYKALEIFGELYFKCRYTLLLEVAKQFEDGAAKYGDNNWQKGIPVRCYIDSAVRHYLKFLRGDKDEPHSRAFCWNILCAIWTCKHKPELNDYGKDDICDSMT